MPSQPVDITVAAILITDAKAEYIHRAHGVERREVVEAMMNRPRYFMDDKGRYALIGPVLSGRFLLVAIEPEDEDGDWRLITAHWLQETRARRIYGGIRE
jgi:hypothetical protein